MTDPVERRRKVLRLTVEIPDVYADDLPDTAALWADGRTPTPRHYLDAVLEEWLREDATITVVTLPGEKSMNDEFGIHGYNCTIVGVSVRDRETGEVLPSAPTATPVWCSRCGTELGGYFLPAIVDGKRRAVCGTCYRFLAPLTFMVPTRMTITCAECGLDNEVGPEDVLTVHGPPPGRYLCASCRPEVT